MGGKNNKMEDRQEKKRNQEEKEKGQTYKEKLAWKKIIIIQKVKNKRKYITKMMGKSKL